MKFSFAHNALPGSLELAYIGDTIYDLHVRSHLIVSGAHVHILHKHAVKFVCAHAQSEALARIEDILTQEESDIVRRARNAKQSPPKNAVPAEYHRATALEALLGWLYVTDRSERLEELLNAALPEEELRLKTNGGTAR